MLGEDGAAGGAATAGGTTTGREGVAAGEAVAAGAAGFSPIGVAVTAGRAGVTTGGAAGDAVGAGATGLAAGCATTGFATIGGTAGRAGGGGAATSLRWVIAFSTSPGREMCDKSILVLISSSPRAGRAVLAGEACASDEPRRCWRTFSASCSSRELECVFFSVTPTIDSTSRMALLLTSSSLARSLIRTLLIRPFLYPALCLSLHLSLTEFSFCIRTSLKNLARAI
jgi:hypothetical protein